MNNDYAEATAGKLQPCKKCSQTCKGKLHRCREMRPVLILFLLINYAAIIVSIAGVYFLPVAVSFPLCIAIYSSTLAAEIRYNRITPIVSLSLSLYLTIFVLYFVSGKDYFLLYAGPIFYFSLAFATLVLLAARHPFTLFYSRRRGLRSLHYAVSIVWSVVYVIAGVTSVLLMPHVAFILLPLGLVLAGIGITLYLQYFSFGRSNKRQKEFQLDRYRFREIGDSVEARESFYAVSLGELWGTVGQTLRRDKVTQKDFTQRILDIDRSYQEDITRFAAYDNGRMIATIQCEEDKRRGLPVEEFAGLRLDPLKKLGKVMGIERWSIRREYRFKPALALGLFKLFFEYALEHDVAFLIVYTYESLVEMEQKTGFVRIFDDPVKNRLVGTETYLLLYNLSRVIVNKVMNGSTTSAQLAPLLNPYLLERYYKRQALANLFRKEEAKTYNYTEQQLISMVRSETAKHELDGAAWVRRRT
ncbi:MAG: hypothetical protein A4E61_01112 [Syntrophorhabdus sp. PtaB.Bin184]|nr:MAG: hypothetical protein A4E61_01112 [Syntrophorhabdus sp. PtaB.Bin184]